MVCAARYSAVKIYKASPYPVLTGKYKRGTLITIFQDVPGFQAETKSSAGNMKRFVHYYWIYIG